MSAISSLVGAVRGGLKAKSARAYIIPLDVFNGDNPVLGDRRAFQYFPQTVTDQKATNYQTKVIPGLSHPLYQWTSGGPRTIAFQAIFTRDRSYTDDEKNEIVTQAGSRKVSDQGSASLSDYTKFSSLNLGNGQGEDQTRNVDIPSAIAMLRSYLDPEYSLNGSKYSEIPSRPRPPRKLILGLPGMRINWGRPQLLADEVYCIMTQCDVTYDGFFSDGSPRMARVDLAFAEIIQIGGTIRVADALPQRQIGLAGYQLGDAKLRGS